MTRGVLVLASILALSGCVQDEDSGRALSLRLLTSGDSLAKPVHASEFAPYPGATPASSGFRGRLRLHTGDKVDHFLLLYDELGLIRPEAPGYDSLPEFDFEFVQHDDLLIPMETGPVVNEHPWWELVLGTGRVWTERDDAGWMRAGLPFALKERREDCVHNGLMTFLFRDSGEVSAVAFQVTSQTCRYLQFDMSGLLAAEYVPGNVDGADATIAAVVANRKGRIPTRPLASLAELYPGARPVAFGSVDEI